MTDNRTADDYIPAPSEEHRRSSASRLAQLCGDLNRATVSARDSAAASPARTRLRIRLCHFKQNHWLTPCLFSFSLASVDENGEAVDQIEAGGEVSFAIVLNHPVESQLRSAVSVIAELVTRQDWIAKIRAGAADIHTIDKDVALLDRHAAEEIQDRLRFGLHSAVAALARSAWERGFQLECRYEPDLLSSRERVMARVPILRNLYNTRSDVREIVDKTVALAGSSRVASAGGPDSMRDLLQRSMTLWNVHKHINHTFRDALVCGNGYLAINVLGSPPVRNLNPSTTRIVSENEFEVETDDGSIELIHTGVVHVRGVEQLVSQYGMSPLEAVLPQVLTVRALSEAAAAAQTMLSSTQVVPSPAKEWAQATIEQRDRVALVTTTSINELFAPFVASLPVPPAELYFAGYEAM